MTTDCQKLLATVQATGASYFVIKFSEDQCISAIPSKRIVEPAAGALATVIVVSFVGQMAAGTRQKC